MRSKFRRMRGRRWTGAVSGPMLALGLTACLAAGPENGSGQRPARLGPGDHEITLEHGGRTRRALVHVPATAGSAPVPLLLAFHGGGGEARGFARYAGFDSLSNVHGFVVAYPYGTGPLPRRLLTWNAGTTCCGWALDHDVDDVGFASALIDEIARRVAIDGRRVYATGHSNGAMMAYRLAAERADRIAAIAPVGGAMNLRPFAPARPVPVLHIHSVDDPRALYGGGPGPPFPGTQRRVVHAPVEAGLEKWRAANGCTAEMRGLEARAAATGSPDAGQNAEHLTWDCPADAPVELWRLHGAGHGWPGGDIGLREELIGPPTTLVNAAAEVWAFVSRFHR